MRNVGIGAAAMAATAVGASLIAQPASALEMAPDEPWLAKLTGKHRQFFDGVSANDGWALVFAANFVNMNMKAYGLTRSEVTAVVGLRHMATPLALNDAMWAKYKLGEFLKVTDKHTNAPATRNVFAQVPAGEGPLSGNGVDQFLAGGGIVTACDMALTALSGMSAAAAGLPPAAAKAEWIANLFPGVAVVPAGVLAVNRAQEYHCSYCYAG
jgi:hypothetical protein